MTAVDHSPVPDFGQMLRLDGVGAVVLGAGQGIGRQVCHALAQSGAKVLCVDRDPALAQAIAAETAGVPCSADVTSREGIAQVFAAARAELPRPGVIVDIVGRAHIAPIESVDDALYQAQHDIVFRHAWLALQAGAPWLAEAGGGSIVFIGSVAGVASFQGQALYGSFKAALHHLARCAAVEWGARGVRVNCVCPGTTRTARLNELIGDGWPDVESSIPLQRAADPADIASAVLFLASAMARHVTAQNLVVDGGVTATTARSGARLNTK
ncbi:SDR family NAD(P)-dependent oxidoreductase [Hydrogenophaga sp.]|uniref:SDR family NAD(P)-dependent oxidoreductase n=1 Tax=Hydrogenophaga sp. TaxID=1904254 RepID=UPI0027221BC7|nr:SDR family oxidoreductase [Hydrogenophaga sp.]MDO9436551.1 SDR family oxidoreductase [Hydrogenophaga sp.]